MLLHWGVVSSLWTTRCAGKQQAIPLASLVDSPDGLGNNLNAHRGAMRQHFISQPDRTTEAMSKGCCKDNTRPHKLAKFLRHLAEAILGYGHLFIESTMIVSTPALPDSLAYLCDQYKHLSCRCAHNSQANWI